MNTSDSQEDELPKATESMQTKKWDIMSYDELRANSCQHRANPVSQETVELIIKNPLVYRAYIQGKTLTLGFRDGNRSSPQAWVNVDFGKDLPPKDYSGSIDSGNGYNLFPKTQIAYEKKQEGVIDLLDSNGDCHRLSLEPTLLEEFVGAMKEAGAVELIDLMEGENAQNLLVKKGIRRVLK